MLVAQPLSVVVCASLLLALAGPAPAQETYAGEGRDIILPWFQWDSHSWALDREVRGSSVCDRAGRVASASQGLLRQVLMMRSVSCPPVRGISPPPCCRSACRLHAHSWRGDRPSFNCVACCWERQRASIALLGDLPQERWRCPAHCVCA